MNKLLKKIIRTQFYHLARTQTTTTTITTITTTQTHNTCNKTSVSYWFLSRFLVQSTGRLFLIAMAPATHTHTHTRAVRQQSGGRWSETSAKHSSPTTNLLLLLLLPGGRNTATFSKPQQRQAYRRQADASLCLTLLIRPFCGGLGWRDKKRPPHPRDGINISAFCNVRRAREAATPLFRLKNVVAVEE